MAQADNLLIVFRNWVDESTLDASTEATPVERVQEMRPSRVWRATDDEEAWARGDIGQEVQAEIFAAVAHNYDTATDLRFRAGIDPDLLSDTPATVDAADVVVDETFRAWRPVGGFGSDGFGLSLGGFPILSDLADYKPYSALKFDPATIRYWRFDIAHATGNANGNFETGRLMLGLALQTGFNIEYGWDWEWIDPSEKVETEESLLIRRRRKYRVIRVSWGHLTEEEAVGKMDDMKRIVGTSRDVLLMVFPTKDDPLQYRTTIYGVPSENGATSNPFFNYYATGMAVRELAK